MVNISTDSRTPGTIEVVELSAQKLDSSAPIDIKSIVASIEFTVSLASPTIFAKMMLIDNIDFLNNGIFTFTGEEFINLSIRRHGTDYKFSYKFIVSTLNSELKSISGDSSVFILTLLSIDSFVNASSFKSKGYTGTITEIIQNILESELNTSISLNRFVDSVDGQTFAFTEIKPFEKISILTPRACLDSTSITSIFMFYENRSGYNFEPFENIMDRAVSNTNIITYTHTPLESINREDGMNSILNYLPRGVFDNHKRMYYGLYKSNVKAFDFITKTVNTQELSILEKMDSLKHLNNTDTGISSNFSQKIKNLGSLTYFIPTDTSTLDRTPRTLLNNSPFSLILQEEALTIKTFGNLAYDVGDPLNIIILDNNQLYNDNKREDPRYSGKYIIHSITYEIGINQHGYTMLNNILLVRDGSLRTLEFYNKQYTSSDIDIEAVKRSN